MNNDELRVKGARHHNLKNINVNIPKNKITALIETNNIKNTYLSLRLKNISKRTYFDQWGTGKNINLKSYSLVDLYASNDLIKNSRILNNKPGSSCPKKFLALGLDAKGKPLCTASKKYQTTQLEDLITQNLDSITFDEKSKLMISTLETLLEDKSSEFDHLFVTIKKPN